MVMRHNARRTHPLSPLSPTTPPLTCTALLASPAALSILCGRSAIISSVHATVCDNTPPAATTTLMASSATVLRATESPDRFLGEAGGGDIGERYEREVWERFGRYGR